MVRTPWEVQGHAGKDETLHRTLYGVVVAMDCDALIAGNSRIRWIRGG